MKIFLTFLCLMSATCVAQTPTQPNIDRRGNALEWVRKSAEYQVAAAQAYRLARLQLDAALSDPSFCADKVQAAAGGYEQLPPAIILDVDETVLDNSEYNRRQMQAQRGYESESWTAWGQERAASPVPGAVEFLKYATSKGVQIFFVTNRKDDLRNPTFDNLTNVGVSTTLDRVMTRNDDDGRGRDKVSRRATVAAGHRIVLLIGDNFADLTAQDREKFKAAPDLLDGWIMLPNPVYGEWESGLPAITPKPIVHPPVVSVPVPDWAFLHGAPLSEGQFLQSTPTSSCCCGCRLRGLNCP